MPKKPTIALLTTGEGHFSISEAIRQTLEPDYHVEIYKKPIALQHFYIFIYRFFPVIFKYPYRLTQNPRVLPVITLISRHLYSLQNAKKILRFLHQAQPQLCITTYFMYLDTLEEYQEKEGVPFLNVVANPVTIHPIEVSQYADQNIYFSDWGWFVRDEYEQPYDQQEVQQELKLNPERLTILMAGGSEGNQQIGYLLPGLLTQPLPLNIVIVNGSNKAMKKVIDTILKRYKPSNKHVINLGFTTELYKYVQAADLIVGKAGPNLLFEAVATKTPFLAVSHISGQEDGNLDIIRDWGVGWVEEKQRQASKLLLNLIQHPEELETAKAGLEKLAAHNHQAKIKLRAYLKHHLG